MITQVFTVFDSKVGSYLAPFFAPSLGGALRSFEKACNTQDHDFNAYAADFTLFHLGEYNDQSATFTFLEAMKSLGKAIEFVNEFDPPTPERAI